MTTNKTANTSFNYALDLFYGIKDAFIPPAEKDLIQRTVNVFLLTHPFPEKGRQFTQAERDYIYLTDSYFVKEKASQMETALFKVLNDLREDSKSPEKAIFDGICHLTAAQWKFSQKKGLFLRPENDYPILKYFKQIALQKGAAKDSHVIQYLNRSIESCSIKAFSCVLSEKEIDSYYKKMDQSNAIRRVVQKPLMALAFLFSYYSYLNRGIVDFLLNNTLVHALDSQRLFDEMRRNSSQNWVGQVGIGIHSSLESFVLFILESLLLERIAKCAAKKMGIREEPIRTNRSQYTLHSIIRSTVIRAPIIEEIAMRGLLQNGLAILQSALLPKGLASPAWPILGSNLYFSLRHATNSDPDNGYLNRSSTAVKISLLMLQPQNSILFATSGFTASLAAHITWNLLSSL